MKRTFRRVREWLRNRKPRPVTIVRVTRASETRVVEIRAATR